MLKLMALTVDHEDWGSDESDFIVHLHIDIGEIATGFPTDLFTVDVVSPKRLSKILLVDDMIIGTGYFIMDDFNINIVREKIERLIKISHDNSYEKMICNLSKYFRNTNEGDI
ncbi:immunity 8 family protein [Salipaludibacillus sp. LMS25]|jgi:hypothetical protein|uniref:Imm8 family immunity protein n=1 Tax=Salipaludibacillus sp. LMS25 TaxID=2924031 RepID=UPI0020D1A2D8|nr:Imm8 family immunity protein [Salipaludibacillus sp. LMS25]UTR13932.1 immunity 8 family protein [Salipaludibacillus sp. LMS25]